MVGEEGIEERGGEVSQRGGGRGRKGEGGEELRQGGRAGEKGPGGGWRGIEGREGMPGVRVVRIAGSPLQPQHMGLELCVSSGMCASEIVCHPVDIKLMMTPPASRDEQTSRRYGTANRRGRRGIR